MFDYIIIGAGSAGCVVANRLSEDYSILLLEAGGPDDSPELRIPTRWFDLMGTEVDWLYRTEPQDHANGRVIDLNRGKVLGGSSSINALLYIRGHRRDYERWAELGNVGWGYDDVLPYFKKLEDNPLGPSNYHGTGGPLNIADVAHILPISEVFIGAGRKLGLPLNKDFNGARQEGIGWYQMTAKNGERHSAVDAYLRPALDRSNLTVETHAQVTRILFEGRRAIGVEYVQNEQTVQIHVEREVILSGGAINSPQILMCSGIGPADHLRALDIPVVSDLPGVGRNLQDHPKVDLHFTSNPLTRLDLSLNGAAQDEYEQSRTGPLSVIRSQVGAFVTIQADSEIPDVQFYAAQADDQQSWDFALVASLLRPLDRGYLRLRSADAFDYPVIQPEYLSHDEDLQTLIKSVRYARELAAGCGDFLGAEVNPGSSVQSDEEIAAWVRSSLESTWHLCGTCKMGVDSMAVVNPQLQVYGVEGLRVVDASIMPEVVGGNTNAPTIMIAEKAAEIIKSL